MNEFFQRVFTYIMKNKKEMLPHLFIYYVLFAFGKATTFLPTTIWSIVNALVAFPLFIWSFFRTLTKMEQDNLSYWDIVFVLILLPIVLIALPFVFILIF